MEPFVLSNKEFNKFRDLIYKEAGISMSDAKIALVQSRLSRRLRSLNINTYKDYYKYLVENFDEEGTDFVNSITTNKTDFFREPHHFKFLEEVVFPEWERSGKKEFRIWSAGCSSGMEPYTIAITINEYFKNKNKPNIKILATDIDSNILDIAKEGVYRLQDVEDIPVNILKRNFFKGNGENEGKFKVKDNLKKMISYQRLNLMDEQYPMKKKFDIIFCRNVVIYFNKDTQQKIFSHYEEYLEDTGFLIIGHSENLTSLDVKFSLVGKTIYKMEP